MYHKIKIIIIRLHTEGDLGFVEILIVSYALFVFKSILFIVMYTGLSSTMIWSVHTTTAPIMERVQHYNNSKWNYA